MVKLFIQRYFGSFNKNCKTLSNGLLIIGLSLISFSCKNSEELRDQFTHEIRIEKIDPVTISFDDLINDYRFIKLETNSESIFGGDPKQILIYRSRIFIVSNIIHCFDMNGSFVYSINKLGRGPGEFIQILNVSINEDDLFITSTKGKILVYDFKTGEFQREFNLGFSVAYCQVDGGYLYLDRKFFTSESTKDKGRIIISSISKPLQGTSFFKEERYSIFIENQFIGYNNTAYFIDPFYNEVFKLKGGKLENFARFDFGDANPTDSEIQTNIESKVTSKPGMRHVGNVKDVYETDGFIIANFMHKNRYSVLYDKKNQKAILYNLFNPGGFAETYQVFPSIPMGVYEDYFYNLINQFMISQIQQTIVSKQIKIDNSHPHFNEYSIIMESHVNDNPIIALYKFNSLKK